MAMLTMVPVLEFKFYPDTVPLGRAYLTFRLAVRKTSLDGLDQVAKFPCDHVMDRLWGSASSCVEASARHHPTTAPNPRKGRQHAQVGQYRLGGVCALRILDSLSNSLQRHRSKMGRSSSRSSEQYAHKLPNAVVHL